MTQFSKKEVIANLRERRAVLDTKLNLIRKLVEEDLPHIGQTVTFRRGFYRITGFEVPEWFKEEMKEDPDG